MRCRDASTGTHEEARWLQPIPQITFGFEPKGKPIVAAFDQPHASSDGGAVLLKSLDTQVQLTKRLAACLVDTRQPGKVQHQALELVRQRIFGLACGYADCNDAARLADDAPVSYTHL